MELLHAFVEKKPQDMKRHMESWFGIVPDDIEDPETGSYLACYCGAWLVPMKKDEDGNILVGAVWHRRGIVTKNA